MKRILVVACSLAVTVGLLPGGRAAGGEDEFVFGVGASEVRQQQALLWTHDDRARELEVFWSPDPLFQTDVRMRRVEVTRHHDGTVRFLARRLTPMTLYYYKFRNPHTGAESRVGRFETAPPPSVPVDVTFAWSGDQDGTIDPETGRPAWNEFETFAQVVSENPDFYVNLGDTIYADSDFLPEPARTLEEYRAVHRQNLSFQNLQDLRAVTGFYSQWDDHEVVNDWDRETVDPDRLRNGLRAFIEYGAMPLPDPGLGFYRTFRWGSEVQIFVLDERSFRSIRGDKIDSDGDGTNDCDNPETGRPDLAPTLSQEWRDFFASQIPGSGLQHPVSEECTANLESPNRTMLGAVQRSQFLSDLRRSRATWKLVMNEDPIQQIFALPYDRWEGYRWERNEVISFIDRHDIDNVVWLTTDVHAYLAHNVDYNKNEPSAGQAVQGMIDYTVGPVATENFRAQINRIAGDDAATKVRFFLLGANGNFCANLGAAPPTPGAPYFGYGLVRISAAERTITVMPKDYSGTPIAGNGVVGGPGHEDEARDRDCYDYVATAVTEDAHAR